MPPAPAGDVLLAYDALQTLVSLALLEPAADVTFTSARTPSQQVVISAPADSVSLPADFFVPGDDVNVVASGAAQARFSGSIAVPAKIDLRVVQSPLVVTSALGDGVGQAGASSMTQDAGAGANTILEWTPSSGGDIEVHIQGIFAPDLQTRRTTVSCVVPLATGRIEVPTPLAQPASLLAGAVYAVTRASASSESGSITLVASRALATLSPATP